MRRGVPVPSSLFDAGMMRKVLSSLLPELRVTVRTLSSHGPWAVFLHIPDIPDLCCADCSFLLSGGITRVVNIRPSDPQKRHRRRATGLATPLEAGLFLTFPGGLFSPFLPLSHPVLTVSPLLLFHHPGHIQGETSHSLTFLTFLVYSCLRGVSTRFSRYSRYIGDLLGF